MTETTAPTPGSTNQNPDGIGFVPLLWEDFVTHGRDLLCPGFWALFLHRCGNLRMSIRPQPLRLPFSLCYNLAFRLFVLMFGIEFCHAVKMGRRVRIWHHGGVFVAARSIGDDVHFRQNIAIGIASRNREEDGLPVIEDHVDIYSGACIAGPLRIGHHAVISANAVITTDVDPGAVMVGNPARRAPGVSNLPEPAADHA